LLRRHEKDGAEYGIHGFDLLAALRLCENGQAEIHNFDLEFPGRKPSEHKVAGLQVAVDQIKVLRGNKCFLRLECKLPEVEPCERRVFDDVVKGLARDEFHDHVRPVLVATEIVNGDDVRVLE
jgi:hypothetical protein